MAALQSQLHAIWQQSLPIMRDRLDCLDAFVVNVKSGRITQQQHADALNIAHKFAGSLGIFGFTAAGKLAQNLEILLRSTGSPDPQLLKRISTSLRASLQL